MRRLRSHTEGVNCFPSKHRLHAGCFCSSGPVATYCKQVLFQKINDVQDPVGINANRDTKCTCQLCTPPWLPSLHRCLQGHRVAMKTRWIRESQLDIWGRTSGEASDVSTLIIFAATPKVRATDLRRSQQEAVYTDQSQRARQQTCGRCQDAGSQSWAPGTSMIKDLLQHFCKVMQLVQSRGPMTCRILVHQQMDYTTVPRILGNECELSWTLKAFIRYVGLAIDWPQSEGPHHSLSCSNVSSSSIHLHLSTALLGLISSMAPLVYIVVNPFITLRVS